MKIGVVLHEGKADAVELGRRLTVWLEERDVQPVMLDSEAAAVDRPDLGASEISTADVVVSLGGDGTLLRAARQVLTEGRPVLGINLGRVGFLAEVEAPAVWSAMEKLLEGAYRVEERSVLACSAVDDDGTELGRYAAINEIVIGVGARRRMVRLSVAINGELFNRYFCDGMILATPTGSTAYSLSCGGPFVSPEAKLVVMTPLCTHSLLNRSAILSERDEVEISVPPEDRGDLFLHMDGYDSGLVPGSFGRLAVASHANRFHLARVQEHSFYTVLRQKLTIWDADEGQ